MSIHFHNVPATFMAVPRAGSTSFKHWVTANIKTCDILVDPQHRGRLAIMPLSYLQNRWGELGTTFTFVRNPYSRLVSIFHYMGQLAEHRIDRRVRKIYDGDELSTPIESDIKILKLYNKGFAYWLEYTANDGGSDPVMAMFLRKHTQLSWLSNTLPDIVIKLEDIHTEFIKIQDLLQCHVPLPHINTSKHHDYKEYYTESSKKVADAVCKLDLETFNYEF